MRPMKMMPGANKKSMLRNFVVAVILVVLCFAALGLVPDKRVIVAQTSFKFFLEMIQIMPAAMILIGLISVWVPREMVVKYLGQASGIKGALVAIVFGSLPMGPLYLAFPLAATLLAKGASVANIIIFLSSWACLKIPFELIELKFLGLEFTALRFVLTAILAIVMGYVIEILNKGKVTKGAPGINR